MIDQLISSGNNPVSIPMQKSAQKQNIPLELSAAPKLAALTAIPKKNARNPFIGAGLYREVS